VTVKYCIKLLRWRSEYHGDEVPVSRFQSPTLVPDDHVSFGSQQEIGKNFLRPLELFPRPTSAPRFSIVKKTFITGRPGLLSQRGVISRHF